MSKPSPVIILGVIGNDIHVVANRVLEICLLGAGFRVFNVGTNNMPEDFADAALECSADAALIGSINGEASHWCRNLREIFCERGMEDIVIYLGGNLVIGDLPEDEIEASFKDSGIDRIFHGGIDFDSMIDSLRKDIDRGRPFF